MNAFVSVLSNVFWYLILMWQDIVLLKSLLLCPFVTFKESKALFYVGVLLYHKTQILFPGIFAKVQGIYLSSSLFNGEYLQEGTCLLSVWFSIPEALNFQTSSMAHSLSKTPWPHFFQPKSAYVPTLRLKNRLNPSWIFWNIYWSLCLCIVCIILQLIW